MKAAVVEIAGQNPFYTDFPEPVPTGNQRIVHVGAAALSQVTRSRAAGTHYSSSGRFPFVAGIDGAGCLDDGTRIYFVMPKAPYGSMAERVAIDLGQCVILPDDIDNVTAAAIANPGMSSWAAYVERLRLRPGETVLVNGATGISGRLAVQIAKYLGAGKVIATGRDLAALASLRALGADVTIALGEDQNALEDAFKAEFAMGVDVVIDYLWGMSTERLLIAAAKAGPEGRAVRVAQIGSTSGETISLPSAVLRSSAIELMGSGIGSIPFAKLIEAIRGVLTAATSGGFEIATATVPLKEVERAWTENDSKSRIVFTP
jgi:NADPH:quinone reductase-like Zn-dependent oxidoreductase